jgi:hypothetical protein
MDIKNDGAQPPLCLFQYSPENPPDSVDQSKALFAVEVYYVITTHFGGRIA